MPTCETCETCRGSRYIVVLAEEIDDLHAYYKMVAGVGFSRVRCTACDGRGSTGAPEPFGEYPPCPPDHKGVTDGTDPTT